ncbi:hypothetical protein RP20_CCG003964 [Aedes albopictus]|nr:hypothetical protein RP20_CCG003964 [Aedes albopictus]
MSVVKSQLPDGFATIRTRGSTRSKQQQGVRTLKSAGSGPLFENNNDLYYKSASTNLINVPPPVPPRTSSELTINSTSKDDHPLATVRTFRDDDDIYYTSSLTYETFKPVKSPALALKSDSSNYITLTQSTDYIDSFNYDFSLPPLKSPQYINELNQMRSRASEMGVAAIYTRAESPPFNKIRSSYRSTTPESLENGSSNSSTYSHPTHPNPKSNGFAYVIQDTDLVTTKPPLNTKSHTLQYRKSFNHSSSRTDIIYEEPKKVLPKNGSHSSDTDSGYDGNYMKIHKNAASTELLSLDVSMNYVANRPNGYIRRYATLGHPRTMNGGGNFGGTMGGALGGDGAESRSTTSLNEREMVKANLLDYKIGCQSTLRSKPVIPWYELAIKRDHRQSCPVVGEEMYGCTTFTKCPIVSHDIYDFVVADLISLGLPATPNNEFDMTIFSDPRPPESHTRTHPLPASECRQPSR